MTALVIAEHDNASLKGNTITAAASPPPNCRHSE